MNGLKKNKWVLLVYVMLLLGLALTSGYLNGSLSGIIQRTEGERRSNHEDDAAALGEILSGSVLRQELTLPRGVLRIGIRFGTYMRSNDSHYQMILYDNAGNVVAKEYLSADSIADNEMCYLQLYGRTSSKISYVLEISSVDAVNGNAMTVYGVQLQPGHSSSTIGGQDTGKELVIELVMQKVFPITTYIAVGITLLLALYLARRRLAEGIRVFITKGKELWNKHHRKIILANIVVAFAAAVATGVCAWEKNVILQDSPSEEEVIVQQYHEKVVQGFESSEAFDAIEIRFATYTQAYSKGELCLSLYEEENGKLLAKQKIPAKQIQDNEFLTFELEEISSEQGTRFYFELEAVDFEEQALSVYYTGNGESVQYQLIQKELTISVDWLLAFVVWGIFWLLIWAACCTSWKREHKQLIIVTILSLFVGLEFSTYVNYQSISMEALTKNLGLAKRGKCREWNADEIEENTKRIFQYDAKGNVYAIYDQILIDDIRSAVDTIEIYPDTTNDIGKKKVIAVYLFQENDAGATSEYECEYEYLAKAQEKVVIPVPSNGRIERAVICFSACNEEMISAQIFNEDYQFYALKKIGLNGERPIWYGKPGAMLAGVMLVWLLYLWKRLRLETAARTWLEAKRGREAKLFFGIAVLFGTLFMLLLPVYQAPDEGAHLRLAFGSIGAEKLYDAARETLGNAVAGVTQHGEVTVDTDAYWTIFTERLENYQFRLAPNLGLFKWPGQACGILLGVALKLPIGWILHLAELCALLVYSALGALAVRITPIKKPLFMMVLLLPMAIQQAGSFSYDSFNNAIAVLTIAYILYLALEKEKVGIKELLRIAGLLLILLWIKKVYVLCGALLLLIPLKKVQISVGGRTIRLTDKKVRRILLGSIPVVLCLGGTVVYFVLLGNNGVSTIFEALRAPLEVGELGLLTIIAQRQIWLKQGSALFGWHDGIIHNWIVWVLLLGMGAAAITGKVRQGSLKHKGYLLCFVVFCANAAGIILSMLGWSFKLLRTEGSVLNQILLCLSIKGVQGRYFLPVIVLLFLLPESRPVHWLREHVPVYLIMVLVSGISIIYSVWMLLQRYWIG